MITRLRCRSFCSGHLRRAMSVMACLLAVTCIGVSTLHAADPTSEMTEEERKRIMAHMSAGEFGMATTAIEELNLPADQQAMMQVMVQAQLANGQPAAAIQTLRDVDGGFGVGGASSEGGAQGEGLGSGADFDSLINLITNTTEGPWEINDGAGGTIEEFETGVRVNPNGMLHTLTRREQSGRLKALGIEARTADLNEDMAAPSQLRMVSLTRLEQEIARRLEQGEPVVESMRQLAGLSEIQYVFIYEDTKDIVIAGPAEGWAYNEQGLPLGVTTGRPTLQLDDLVTVLRTFDDSGQQIFGCSINPRTEGLKAIKEYAEASLARGPLSANRVRSWAKQLGQKLGLQDIEIYGIPADSRVARVIVEADYRMKLIGIGKLDGGSQIPDYFELLRENPSQASGSLDALRWWLTMKYDSVLHSDDHSAFEIKGSSVLCQSENQFVTADGGRVQTGKAEPINRAFAANFTQHYDELAQQDSIFADLQGVFDLALVSALLQYENIDNRLDWDLGVFATDGAYQTQRYEAPTVCESVVNHRVFNGRDIVVQVAGGVRADLLAVVKNDKLRNESPRVANVAAEGAAPELPAGRWWWDAK